MDNYKFSVIILLNRLDNLEITLNSLYDQTFKNFEIICLNSTSDNISIENIKVINNETVGSVLTKISGEYVLFINPGDYFLPNSLNFLNGVLSDEKDMVLFRSEDYSQECDINKDNYDLKLKDFSNRDDKEVSGSEIFSNTFLSNLKNINNKLFSKKFLNSTYENIFDKDTPINFVFDIKASIVAKKTVSIDEKIIFHKIDNSNEDFKIIMERVAIRGLSSLEILESVKEIEKFLLKSNFYNKYKHDFIKFKLKILTDNLDISKFHDYTLYIPEHERNNLKSKKFDYSKYYNSNSIYVGLPESYSNKLFNKTKKYLSKTEITDDDMKFLIEDYSFNMLFEKYRGILNSYDFKDYILYSNKSTLNDLKEENIRLKTECEYLTNDLEVYEKIICDEYRLINESKKIISSTKVNIEYMDSSNSKLVQLNKNSSSLFEKFKDKSR